MKKCLIISFLLSLMILISGCMSKDDRFKEMSQVDLFDGRSNEMAVESESDEMVTEEIAEDSSKENLVAERKVIHRASLQLRVKEYEKARANIEQAIEKYEGYIVESTVYYDEADMSNGHMVIRIPAQHFQTFLADTEKEATNVIERHITGEDVTEQYIDLDARLTSKRIVEERLIGFMENAEQTEDLLKISSDLSAVQEEIETLVGKINYLKNQTDFSTIDIGLIEDRIITPNMGGQEYNTWDKTKKQFFTSINFLLAVGSGFIVFFLGNMPVILLIVGVGFILFYIIRRTVKGHM